MSFESFRAGMISRLAPVLPEDHLQEVLRALDDMAQSWEFTPKSTAIITSGGIMIKIKVAEIRTTGRSTQGVKLIKLGEGDSVSSIARIPTTEAPEKE